MKKSIVSGLALISASFAQQPATTTPALTTEAGADKMRGVLSSQIFMLFGKALESSPTTDINDAANVLQVPPLNINAAQAQVWGTIILRYLLKVEPIASAPAGDLLDLLTPAIQRYLAG